MAGDRALSLLIDIKAVNSFSGVLGLLKSSFAGLFNSLGNLVFGFRNLGTAGTIGMDALKLGAAGLVKSLLMISAVLGLVAIAIGIGLGVAAVKAAGEFQKEMLKVYALTGMSKGAFDKMTASILAMAPAVATGPVELAKALYPIESDGFKGANALNVLRLSAIAAKIGLADVNTVAFALTSGIRAFGFADSQATYVMNIMNNTVRQGKMEWQAYAVQVGRLSTAAKTAGYSFIESNAALATLTQSGSSAAKATTFLINLFNQLNLKTDAMAKHAKAAGIAFDEQKFKTMSLAQQIDYITKVTHGNASEVMKLMGNNSVAARGYELLAKHSKTYADILKNLNASQQAGNTLMDSWAKTQQGFTVQLDKAKAAWQVLLITIGNQLLPVLTRVAAAVVPIIVQFTAWFARSNALQGVIKAVTDTITFMAPAVMAVVGALAAFAGWVVKVIASLHLQNEAMIALKGVAILLGVALLLILAPFIILAVAVVAAIVGILLAIRGIIIAFNWLKQAGIDAWNWIKTAAMNTWNWLKTAWGNIGAFFNGVWASVKSTATGAWNGLIAFLKGVWETIKGIFKGGVDAVVGFFKWLYDHNYYFKDLVDTIRTVVQSVVDWLKTAWANTVKWIGDRWNEMKALAQKAWDAVKGVFQAVWGWLSGIFNTIWSNISKWWSTTSSNTSKAATDLWTKVKGVFSSAWSTYISGPLTSLGNSIGSFFSGLATKALAWGKAVIQGLIDGINSMLGALGKAAADAADAVAKALGFHSPPEWGPASDSDQWAPNFIRMFASGLLSGVPQILAAARAVAAATALGSSYALGSTLYASGGGWSNTRPTGSSFAATSRVIYNVIYIQPPSIKLDGREVTDAIGRRQAREIRVQGNARNA